MGNKVKELHGSNRVTLYKELPVSTPFGIFIEPSSACNFECCYCPHSIGKNVFEKKIRKFGNMSMDTMYIIVEQMKEFEDKIKLVEFSGMGEPLLNADFPKMIKLVKESGCARHIRMITNAVLLTPDVSEQLIDAGVDSVRVSMQGITDESYKRITGREGSFKKIIDNLRYFYEHRGASQLFLKNINIALNEKEKKEFVDRFSEIADRVYIENIVPFFNHVDYSDIVEDFCEDRYHRKVTDIDICPNAFTTIDLNIFGDISICGQVDKPVILGNVNNVTLKEAWDSEIRNDFLMQQLNRKRYNNSVCNKCKIPSCSLASEQDIIDGHEVEIINRLKGR